MSENLKIDPYGFREYDARWLYEKDINDEGITNLGKGLGTQIIKNTKKQNKDGSKIYRMLCAFLDGFFQLDGPHGYSAVSKWELHGEWKVITLLTC